MMAKVPEVKAIIGNKAAENSPRNIAEQINNLLLYFVKK
jgi:hypothetical protein